MIPHSPKLAPIRDSTLQRSRLSAQKLPQIRSLRKHGEQIRQKSRNGFASSRKDGPTLIAKELHIIGETAKLVEKAATAFFFSFSISRVLFCVCEFGQFDNVSHLLVDKLVDSLNVFGVIVAEFILWITAGGGTECRIIFTDHLSPQGDWGLVSSYSAYRIIFQA